MTKQRKKKRAPARPKKAKPSTALARREETRVEILPPPDPAARTVDAGLMLGELGLVELKLKPKEEQTLARPVALERVRIKPTGQVYLPHQDYTRWFNEAFGRLGWSLVPIGKPILQGSSVVCPYVLYIHGKPVRFAYGEQEYFEKNREQTYGDALESTVASALRRVAKRLGVALELWDKDFGDRFVAEHCVHVPVKQKNGDVRWMWRRKQDPVFPYEMSPTDPAARGGQASQRQEAPTWQEQGAAPRAGHHRESGTRISDPQRKRLWVIIRNSGRDEEQVRQWIERRFGWTSSKDVTRDRYEYICTAIEAPGPLPEAPERS